MGTGQLRGPDKPLHHRFLLGVFTVSQILLMSCTSVFDFSIMFHTVSGFDMAIQRLHCHQLPAVQSHKSKPRPVRPVIWLLPQAVDDLTPLHKRSDRTDYDLLVRNRFILSYTGNNINLIADAAPIPFAYLRLAISPSFGIYSVAHGLCLQSGFWTPPRRFPTNRRVVERMLLSPSCKPANGTPLIPIRLALYGSCMRTIVQVPQFEWYSTDFILQHCPVVAPTGSTFDADLLICCVC